MNFSAQLKYGIIAATLVLCYTPISIAQESSKLLTAVQEHLNALGYEAGPTDGLMGRKTRSALDEFYRNNNLEWNGELTNRVLEDLAEAAPKNSSETLSDLEWRNKFEKEICFAGVSLRSRWGYPGQAEPGTFAGKQGSVYSYRSYDGGSTINCLIEGSKLHMSWSTKFNKNDQNRYYTYERTNDGVKITEFQWGNVETKIYPIE